MRRSSSSACCNGARAALATLAALAALAAAPARAQAPVEVPALDFRAPASMVPFADELERIDRRRIAAVMRLVGLRDPGRPILVVLAPEDSELARRSPSWVAGYTRGGSGVIVLFPRRAGSYPHDSLEELLQHEVAHVLIARAAGGRAVPRWFHEGLALTAEHAWDFGDRARFVYEVARRGVIPIGQLDPLFEESEPSVMLAYSVAGAFVQDLLVEHGPGWPARLLAAMRGGASFDDAFARTTGTSVAAASDAFWGDRRLVAVWLPWVTSPATMWSVITLLAIAAIVQLRRRRAARRRQWELEGDV